MTTDVTPVRRVVPLFGIPDATTASSPTIRTPRPIIRANVASRGPSTPKIATLATPRQFSAKPRRSPSANQNVFATPRSAFNTSARTPSPCGSPLGAGNSLNSSSNSIITSKPAPLLSASMLHDANAVFKDYAIVMAPSLVPRTPSPSLASSYSGSAVDRALGKTPRTSSTTSRNGMSRVASSVSPQRTSSPALLTSARGRRSPFDEPPPILTMIPRPLLMAALARLRLNFSETELSAEVTMSSSKYGLSRDEFLLLVQNNVTRRMSIERVITAFLTLQPTGVMGVDELRRFMVSAALRQEGDTYGDDDFEPLTLDEFDVFCGQADPKGSGMVHIARLLGCFFPKAPRSLVEGLLEKNGVGATSFANQRKTAESDEAADRATIVFMQYDDAQELLEMREFVANAAAREAAELQHLRHQRNERQAVELLESPDRETIERKMAKHWRRLVDWKVAEEAEVVIRIRKRKIRDTKASVYCWRIVDDQPSVLYAEGVCKSTSGSFVLSATNNRASPNRPNPAASLQ